MFTRTSMSPETSEVMNSIVDEVYGNLVTRIAQGRKKTPDAVRALIDQGPLLANDALHEGLVDELRYEDQMFGDLQQKLNSGEIHKLTTAKYLKITPGSLGLEGSRRIAMLVGDGSITRGSSEDEASDGITEEGFNKVLRRIARDSSVAGVVVRIDSPGGDAVASDAIWREMNLLSKKKPMVISMSDTAASGGYYMAMTGDRIVAYPGTLTGSIGVVFGKPNLHGLYDKLGITKDMIKRGRFADIDSDYTELTPAALEKLKDGIDANYRDFVGKVAQARRRTFDQIEPLAQGRVWLGSQALSRGLVDDLGGLDRALELVKQKAKIPASENVTIVMYPARRSILDLVFGRSTEGVFESRLRPLLKDWPVEMWAKGGLLRVMPYSVKVQ